MPRNVVDTSTPIDKRIAYTRPPAKLNLFLELLARRHDGYHEIDTVMLPIDWRDGLMLQRTAGPGIELQVRWAPSKRIIADRLGITDDTERVQAMLEIPDTPSNLVYQALEQFQECFRVPGGFRCQLHKQIPAGAGMGGASSDAAAALRCAAALCDFSAEPQELAAIASKIGSDVPFFLGAPMDVQGSSHLRSETRKYGRSLAARATGRGEQIHTIEMANRLDFVVAYPCRSLATAAVYASCSVPISPLPSADMIEALRHGQKNHVGRLLFNRLSEPAKKIAPVIDEIHESMWRCGLQACQLTGSGSACFALATSAAAARRDAARLRAILQPGVIVRVAQSTFLPSSVFIQ